MRIFIIIIFIFVGFIIFAEPVIFNYDFIYSYLPLNTLCEWENHRIIDNPDKKDLSSFVEFNIDILFFNLIFIGGNMRNNFYKDMENFSFFPDMMRFKFNAGFRFSDSLEIGFNHFCYHPVIPYLGIKSLPVVTWEGAYEKIYIKFHGSTKIK